MKLICPRQHDYANNLCSAHTYVCFSSPCVTHHGGVRKMHCRGDSTHTGLIISIRCKYESNRDTILLEGFLHSAFLLLLWCISPILPEMGFIMQILTGAKTFHTVLPSLRMLWLCRLSVFCSWIITNVKSHTASPVYNIFSSLIKLRLLFLL